MKKLVLLLALALIPFASVKAESYIQFFSPLKGVYVVDVNTAECKDCIVPYITDRLDTVESVAIKNNVRVAINAGFFDPQNKQTTSYVLVNGSMVADPNNNTSLISNPGLKPYLPLILDRSEFRILSCNDGLRYDIAKHSQLVAPGCSVWHSVQAGPELLPQLRLKEEAFVVRKDGKVIKESAGALGKHARSAVGIKDGHVLFVAVSNAAAMTIEDLSVLMKTLGTEKALAFDGGSSTSLYVNSEDVRFVLTSAKDNSARRVKSFIFVK